MLTKADDYLIHQTPDPIAIVGTSDRNFYDRYFFNGYSRDGETFFACALGAYPNRKIMDAAFSVLRRGRQHVVRASRVLRADRMETVVGPISVEVVEPLRRLRVRVERNRWDLSADLLFTARLHPIEEPRFHRRIDTRLLLDYTRLTQHGQWSGSLCVGGDSVEIRETEWWGTRDRSWGIRPVGEREAGVPLAPVQFFWLWSPIHFEDLCTHFDVNEDAEGDRWHQFGAVGKVGEPIKIMRAVDYSLALRPGTRHAEKATITLVPQRGDPHEIQLHVLYNFYMVGLGYGHPQWGHGMFVGESAIDGESWNLADVDPTVPLYLHVEAICEARLGKRRGIGVLEQLILGPHAPTGLRDFLDMAPAAR